MAHDDLHGRRCPSCGSRLRPGTRRCQICGVVAPWHHGHGRVAAESLTVVVVVLGLVAAGTWLRRPRIETSTAVTPVVPVLLAQRPTDLPTLTAAPSATASREPNTPRPPTPTPLPETITHTVASGDTLFGIAARYGVRAEAITAANGLARPEALSIGQQLRVPVAPTPGGEPPTAPPEAVAEATVDVQPTTAAAAPTGVPATGEPVVVREAEVHTVAAGDTLGGIASASGVAVEEILRLNADWIGSEDHVLQVGDRVIVRGAEIVTATPAAAGFDEGPPALAAGTVGEVAPVPFEASAATSYDAPLALAPSGGVEVHDPPVLRWTSVGPLPRGVAYLVTIRQAGGGDEAREWVPANATALRLPARFRPALGAERDLEWMVAVHRRAGILGGDVGLAVSPTGGWQRFTWAPGVAPTP